MTLFAKYGKIVRLEMRLMKKQSLLIDQCSSINLVARLPVQFAFVTLVLSFVINVTAQGLTTSTGQSLIYNPLATTTTSSSESYSTRSQLDSSQFMSTPVTTTTPVVTTILPTRQYNNLNNIPTNRYYNSNHININEIPSPDINRTLSQEIQKQSDSANRNQLDSGIIRSNQQLNQFPKYYKFTLISGKFWKFSEKPNVFSDFSEVELRLHKNISNSYVIDDDNWFQFDQQQQIFYAWPSFLTKPGLYYFVLNPSGLDLDADSENNPVPFVASLVVDLQRPRFRLNNSSQSLSVRSDEEIVNDLFDHKFSLDNLSRQYSISLFLDQLIGIFNSLTRATSKHSTTTSSTTQDQAAILSKIITQTTPISIATSSSSTPFGQKNSKLSHAKLSEYLLIDSRYSSDEEYFSITWSSHTSLIKNTLNNVHECQLQNIKEIISTFAQLSSGYTNTSKFIIHYPIDPTLLKTNALVPTKRGDFELKLHLNSACQKEKIIQELGLDLTAHNNFRTVFINDTTIVRPTIVPQTARSTTVSTLDNLHLARNNTHHNIDNNVIIDQASHNSSARNRLKSTSIDKNQIVDSSLRSSESREVGISLTHNRDKSYPRNKSQIHDPENEERVQYAKRTPSAISTSSYTLIKPTPVGPINSSPENITIANIPKRNSVDITNSLQTIDRPQPRPSYSFNSTELITTTEPVINRALSFNEISLNNANSTHYSTIRSTASVAKQTSIEPKFLIPTTESPNSTRSSTSTSITTTARPQTKSFAKFVDSFDTANGDVKVTTGQNPVSHTITNHHQVTITKPTTLIPMSSDSTHSTTISPRTTNLLSTTTAMSPNTQNNMNVSTLFVNTPAYNQSTTPLRPYSFIDGTPTTTIPTNKLYSSNNDLLITTTTSPTTIHEPTLNDEFIDILKDIMEYLASIAVPLVFILGIILVVSIIIAFCSLQHKKRKSRQFKVVDRFNFRYGSERRAFLKNRSKPVILEADQKSLSMGSVTPLHVPKIKGLPMNSTSINSYLNQNGKSNGKPNGKQQHKDNKNHKKHSKTDKNDIVYLAMQPIIPPK